MRIVWPHPSTGKTAPSYPTERSMTMILPSHCHQAQEYSSSHPTSFRNASAISDITSHVSFDTLLLSPLGIKCRYPSLRKHSTDSLFTTFSHTLSQSDRQEGLRGWMTHDSDCLQMASLQMANWNLNNPSAMARWTLRVGMRTASRPSNLHPILHTRRHPKILRSRRLGEA